MRSDKKLVTVEETINKLRNDKLFSPEELRFLDPLAEILLYRWRRVSKKIDNLNTLSNLRGSKTISISDQMMLRSYYEQVLRMRLVIEEVIGDHVHSKNHFLEGMKIIKEILELIKKESQKIKFDFYLAFLNE